MNRERFSTGEAVVLAIAIGSGELVAVGRAADVAHVDERGIDDELIVVDAVIRDDLSESLDEEFATRETSVPARHVEVSGLTAHVLAGARMVSDALVEGPATVTGTDDDGQAQRIAKRLQRVAAQVSQAIHSLGRRYVGDTVLAGRRTH